MNKRMRELLAAMEAKQAEVKGFTDGETKDLDKASEILDEIDAMKKEYDVLERSMNMEKSAVDADEAVEEKADDAVKSFATAARHGFKNMNEGTAADGGYTVPEDISTMVQEYRSAKASLVDLVDLEGVSTMSGRRTFKKRSQQTGFSLVGEGATIGSKATPQFEPLSYSIKKYAGILPVTNELLKDSDANIVQVLTQWIADESRVTRNGLIIDKLKSATPEDITGIDDIKKALNVTLGQAFKPTSTIVTNDDGLQWLDTLKDEEGKYLLQPSPADPMKMVLCAGATTVPVVVIPNSDLATDSDAVPFFIGDLKEAVKFFDRENMTIMQSDVAVAGELNAFDEDLTLFRAIEREDVVVKDADAWVYATYTATQG